MLVPALGENTAYNEVFTAVSSEAADRGYCVMLGCSGRSISMEKEYCRIMSEHQIGALIVAPTSSNIQHISTICKNIPLIFIGGKTGLEQKYALINDYRNSARLVVEHLHGLGHTDIALFTYAPENLTILQKEEGFTEQMQHHGLLPRIYRSGVSDDTLNAGREITLQLIAANKLPTAIWCASDLMAIGVLDVLKEKGLQVPEDVSLVGHDNLYFDRFPGIGLTTLETPKEELGIYAVELAISLIEDKDTKPNSKKIFKTSLVIRSSTGNPPKR